MSLIKRQIPRLISFIPSTNPYAYGSVIAEFGNTKIHITASLEEGIPSWLRGTGKGWITAEYSMLPGATHTRSRRERGHIGGRTYEIQRLIGRSLRAAVDLKKLGEKSLVVDCDVIVADGGTRTTAISGAYIAMMLAFHRMKKEGMIQEIPVTEQIAALSVGVTSDGNIIADLNYEEDSSCNTDMNIVMTRSHKFIEIQGTAEGNPFSRKELDDLLSCASHALEYVFKAQDEILEVVNE